MRQTAKRLRLFFIYSALALITFIAFESVRHNNFISLDDYAYVTQNQHVRGGITRESVIWAFTTPHGGFAYWQPLTWLSHMLDCQLFDLDPQGHHLTSLLFHTVNALLLFGVLKSITGTLWRSAFVAAAFALHPLRVESVAWVAERKDVLSVFFWILTIAAYARYAARPGLKRYLLVVLALCLGLMTKPMLVTVPFVLLLLDYWPLGRFKWKSKNRAEDFRQYKYNKVTYQISSLRRLIGEKIPLFILALVASVVTFVVVGDIGARAVNLPLKLRMANALASYISYIIKMFYPSRLAVFYPYPAKGLPSWQPIVCFMILACVSAAVIYTARRRRYLAVGWLWYLGTLVPVIGLVQAGSQAMADRFTYLPSIGIFIMVVWGTAELLSEWRHRNICLGVLAGLLLAAMMICTRTQVQRWKNNLTLYQHTLAVTEDNSIIENSYGCALFEEGQLDEAVAHLKKALRISPKFPLYRSNLGRVFLKQGKVDEAIASFNEVLSTNKDWPDVHYFLGLAKVRQGKHDDAIRHFTEALRINPNHLEARNGLGRAFLAAGKLDQAVACFKEVLQSRTDRADVYADLGTAYSRLGNYDLTVANWIQAVALKPDSFGLLNNLAWILATHKQAQLRDPKEAIRLAERACELTKYEQPGILDTLAAAYAAAGRFQDAIETAGQAINLAEAAGKESLAQEIQKHLQLYQAGRPYREK